MKPSRFALRHRSKTRTLPLQVRTEEPLVARIDAWIFRHGELMTRAEAIRRLTALGLSASEKTGLAASHCHD
jgi:hypothetical protein